MLKSSISLQIATNLYNSTPTPSHGWKGKLQVKTCTCKNALPNYAADQADRGPANVLDMANLRLTDEERDYIASIPYFDETYVDFLYSFRFRPSEQVHLKYDPVTRDLELEVTGAWQDTILYEVPLLALISESYFRFVDQDWNYDGQVEKAKEKTRRLLEAGCKFSEFGTRRRRSYKAHEIVMQSIYEAAQEYKDLNLEGAFSGTSNVYLAKRFNVNPIGTVGKPHSYRKLSCYKCMCSLFSSPAAHEFFMAISALENNVQHANGIAIQKWLETYNGALSIALTDTFTTDVFLRDFNYDLASKCIGVRQDSGDPAEFVYHMIDHYKSLGINPKTKTIVFSDSLDVEKAISLLKLCKEAGTNASFGIGTSFTNDFVKASSNGKEKSKPMNMVIKMKYCNGKRVIKLSDDVLKHSASDDLVEKLKKELNIA